MPHRQVVLWHGTDPTTELPVYVLVGATERREVVFEHTLERVPHAFSPWNAANNRDVWCVRDKQHLSADAAHTMLAGIRGSYIKYL